MGGEVDEVMESQKRIREINDKINALHSDIDEVKEVLNKSDNLKGDIKQKLRSIIRDLDMKLIHLVNLRAQEQKQHTQLEAERVIRKHT